MKSENDEIRSYARILAARWGVAAEPLAQMGLANAQLGDSTPEVLTAMARKAMRDADALQRQSRS